MIRPEASDVQSLSLCWVDVMAPSTDSRLTLDLMLEAARERVMSPPKWGKRDEENAPVPYSCVSMF